MATVSPATSQEPATSNSADPLTNYQLPLVPSRRELAERAWQLHELGNSLASIRATLESAGGTPADIRVVMDKLAALERARRARFQQRLQWTLLGGLTVIIVFVALAIVVSSLAAPAAPAATSALATPGPGTVTPSGTRLPATPTLVFNPIIALINGVLPGGARLANGASATPAPTLSAPELSTRIASSTGLPSWVATLVPNGVMELSGPTPSVDSNGPPGAACPATSDQASALFGGPAANWSFNRSERNWILILRGQPASVRVPDGMSASYPVIGQTLEMRAVLGPATVNNVNFIALSCR
jgi:hypothetical protein